MFELHTTTHTVLREKWSRKAERDGELKRPNVRGPADVQYARTGKIRYIVQTEEVFWFCVYSQWLIYNDLYILADAPLVAVGL
jgi:hypothetical protein